MTAPHISTLASPWRKAIRVVVAAFPLVACWYSSARAQSEDGEPVAVWEMCHNLEAKPLRLVLMKDGSTGGGEKWELDPPRFDFGQYKCRVAADGLRFQGRHGGGGHAAGRLLYRGIMPASEPATTVAVEAEAENKVVDLPKKAGKKTGAPAKPAGNRMVGPFELTGVSRNGRRISVSTMFTSDGQVLDEDRRIATWNRDKHVTLSFLDERLGEIGLTARKADIYEGKSKGTDKDNWTWSVARIQPVVECKVDGGGYFSGTLTLYSNGRINAPIRTDECRGYWSSSSGALEFNEFFTCRLSADRRSFTNNGGLEIKGVVTAGSFGQ